MFTLGSSPSSLTVQRPPTFMLLLVLSLAATVMMFSSQAQALMLNEHHGMNEYCYPFWGSDTARISADTLYLAVRRGFTPGNYWVAWDNGNASGSIFFYLAPDGSYTKSGESTVNATQVGMAGGTTNLIVYAPNGASTTLSGATLTYQRSCDFDFDCSV